MMQKKAILGISAFYHDSAAALLLNGRIIAAAQEERFTRIKHDPDFPRLAIQYCLQAADLQLTDVDKIVFYDKPLLTFDRLLETHMSFAPRGLKTYLQRMPVWLKDKLFLKRLLRTHLSKLGACAIKSLPPLLFTEHHQSHAASAFYPSPFESAAVLCMDGVGEWATTSAWHGQMEKLEPLWQINFPHSLGLLYSAFTYYTGFKVNSGEYKLMGLAPYGKPVFARQIREHLIDIKDDGSFQLNQEYFNYSIGERMTSEAFDQLFDGPPRIPESPITDREMNIAASIQLITEDVVLKLARTLHLESGEENLCLAGGVALNCSANGKLASAGIFKNIWIQPAAGDAGGALGAAFAAWHLHGGQPRSDIGSDAMRGAYLGPEFTTGEINTFLSDRKVPHKLYEDEELFSTVAQLIDAGQVIGWFQGPMEFGPRALGNRSIIADSRKPEMQTKLNNKIKFRESFRPFAPSVLEEDSEHYFEFAGISPYMMFVSEVQKNLRVEGSQLAMDKQVGLDKLACHRSSIPAVTHVDYTARLQTVSKSTNPRFHQLISEFKNISGCSVLINTSFNIRGEPIVCTPEDAFRCFMNTDMDYLVLGNHVLSKAEQTLVQEPSVRKNDLPSSALD
ncbi:MAG: carbamoyltransferase [Planctomycetota bacterium]|jgi:carbamoyltransferase